MNIAMATMASQEAHTADTGINQRLKHANGDRTRINIYYMSFQL